MCIPGTEYGTASLVVLSFVTVIYAAVTSVLFRLLSFELVWCFFVVAVSCVACRRFFHYRFILLPFFRCVWFFYVLWDGVPSHDICLLPPRACGVCPSGAARGPNLAVLRPRSQVPPFLLVPFRIVACFCFCSYTPLPLHCLPRIIRKSLFAVSSSAWSFSSACACVWCTCARAGGARGPNLAVLHRHGRHRSPSPVEAPAAARQNSGRP